MKQIKTALIIIDMQEDYIGEKSKYDYYPITLVTKVNDRITKAVNEEELIIYVKNRGRRKKEVYISDFVLGLFVASNLIIEKGKSSIFDNNILLDMLTKYKISQVELIGIDGNCCVASSAVDASKLGFSVVYPLEYIGIRNSQRFLKTRVKLLKSHVEIIELQEGKCLE